MGLNQEVSSVLRTKPVPNTFPSNIHCRDGAGARGGAGDALQALLGPGSGREFPGRQASSYARGKLTGGRKEEAARAGSLHRNVCVFPRFSSLRATATGSCVSQLSTTPWARSVHTSQPVEGVVLSQKAG